jgi:rRNA-processing protein FCF1
MKRVAIQDANILIDLIKANLFTHCMQLGYRFYTTDIILEELYEEQAALIHPFILSKVFQVIPISQEELIEIKEQTLFHPRLSEQDCSAFYYAQKLNALLITGDKYLKEKALTSGLEAHGILWIFDELVFHDILTKTDAINSLRVLMTKNKRLPFEECKKRLEVWSI